MVRVKQMLMDAAEIMDAWRVVPRALVTGYAILVVKVVIWYMNLEPSIPSDLKPFIQTASDASLAIHDQPSTQHAALVTAVIGFGAAVFGLYANTGRRWDGSYKPNYQPPQYQPPSFPQQHTPYNPSLGSGYTPPTGRPPTAYELYEEGPETASRPPNPPRTRPEK